MGVDEQQVAEERHAFELESKSISPSFQLHSVRPGQSVIPAVAVAPLITAEAGVPLARRE